MGTSDVCRNGQHHLCQNVTLYGWPPCQCSCHETKLIGTGRTPSEQDAFDWYMLDFITLREFLDKECALGSIGDRPRREALEISEGTGDGHEPSPVTTYTPEKNA